MIYLNGSFIPIEDARISVLDRGFIFGDGVYEVIPAYSHIPFRLAEHLRRLQKSLDGIQLRNPYTDIEWRKLLEQIINKNGDSALSAIKRKAICSNYESSIPKIFA